MLRELHIVNLAVIAEARVELAGGLNCFTGATGAGKSLVIGAINVLLGLKSAADLLRKGESEGHVTGVFEVSNARLLSQIADEIDLPLSKAEAKDGELIVQRRLFASGRTRVTLNGNPITLGQLKTLGEALVDVHGQHDSAYLLRPGNQLDVLDQFAGNDDRRDLYSNVFGELQRAKARLRELAEGDELRRQTLELLRFQHDELEKAALDPAEFEKLQSRAGVLENLERLQTESAEALEELDTDEGAIVDRLKRMTRRLDELGTLDSSLLPMAEQVRGGMLQLEEAARDLDRYRDKLDLDPEELHDINTRLTLIQKILQKYGGTMESALAQQADITARMKSLTGESADLSQLQATIAEREKDVRDLASKLREKRQSAAKKLGPAVQKQLAELGMEKATFRVDLSELSEPTPTGFDGVEFIVQTNPGLDPQPLRRIASGGELSRFMLALKQTLSDDSGRVSVLVFDEIDANVGGRLASVVGDKLRKLSGGHQVLCITHLPQIASYADRHLTVQKIQGSDTKTTVRVIDGDERLEELAEMIGGKTITETTRAQAREMMGAALGTTRKRRKAS